MLLLGTAFAHSSIVRAQHGHRPMASGARAVTTLDMLNPTSGWGWGASIVVRAIDGASQFVDVTPAGVGAAHPVAALVALAARTAWVVTSSTAPPERLTLYRTRNGGATWSSTPLGSHGGTDVTFVDPLHGWMLGSQSTANHRANEITLSHTIDGGRTSTAIYRTRQRLSIQPNVQTGDCQWSQVRFTTPSHGIAALTCDRSSTLKVDVTDDGGRTWRRMSLPSFHRPPGVVLFSSVQPPFFSGKDGVTLGELCVGDSLSCRYYGTLYHTTNGGRTWTAAPSVVEPGPGVIFADAEHAWLQYGCLRSCPSNVQLLATRNGGASWAAIPLPRILGPNMHGGQLFQFVSPSLGFAVIGQEFDPQVHYFRTIDGGRTFRAFQPRLVART